MNTVAPLYPLSLRVQDMACLVVGAGRVAPRKAASLLECGAEVTVLAPKVCAAVEELNVTIVRRRYERGDLAGYRLVLTATGVDEVDRAVFLEAEETGILVNAADNPQACRFILPAVLRQGPVTIAVSTGGASPYLAVFLRQRIREVVGSEFAALAALLADARQVLKASGRSTERADWGALVDEGLVSLLASGHMSQARDRVEMWLAVELAGIGGSEQSGSATQAVPVSFLEA